MVTMTNGRMAHLLSVETHRAIGPVISWIEDNIRTGKAEPDYGTYCSEVIQEVTVRYKESVDYEVVGGKVVSVCTGWKSEPYFENPSKPTKKEIDLLEVCEYSHYKWLKKHCHEIMDILNHPHSSTICYHVMEETCSGSGCEKIGPVNYHGGKHWEYYCGGSPRCCP